MQILSICFCTLCRADRDLQELRRQLDDRIDILSREVEEGESAFHVRIIFCSPSHVKTSAELLCDQDEDWKDEPKQKMRCLHMWQINFIRLRLFTYTFKQIVQSKQLIIPLISMAALQSLHLQSNFIDGRRIWLGTALSLNTLLSPSQSSLPSSNALRVTHYTGCGRVYSSLIF